MHVARDHHERARSQGRARSRRLVALHRAAALQSTRYADPSGWMFTQRIRARTFHGCMLAPLVVRARCIGATRSRVVSEKAQNHSSRRPASTLQ